MSTVTVKIENAYADGHESVHEVEVTAPTATDWDSMDTWWEDEVLPHTGDGHGAKHPKLGAYYEATIIRADEPLLVSMHREWD